MILAVVFNSGVDAQNGGMRGGRGGGDRPRDGNVGGFGNFIPRNASNTTFHGPPDGPDGFPHPDFGGCGEGPRGPPRGNVTLNCTAVASQPACPAGRNGTIEEGTWVCRQGFDRRSGTQMSFSTCVSPTHGLNTDVCGCCNATCPQPCLCTCDLIQAGDGLGVVVIDSMDMEEVCMPPGRAFHLTTRSDDFSCKTECGTA